MGHGIPRQGPSGSGLLRLALCLFLVGQGAEGHHPTGKPQHQRGGRPTEACKWLPFVNVPFLPAWTELADAPGRSPTAAWEPLNFLPPLSPQNCFELYNPSHKGQVIKACKTEADGRVVEGNHVVYRISAPSPEEKEEWMKSIK